MVLNYSFEYLSNNNTLINFLIRIADESNIPFEIVRQNSIIDFYCEADVDTLTSFANNISTDLPMSIFLKKTEVKEVDQMPKKTLFEDRQKEFELSFCPKCLREVEDESSLNYYNPFTTCDLCVPSTKQNQLIYSQDNQEIHYENYKELFVRVAQKISEGLRLKVQTHSGTFVFKKYEPTDYEPKLLCCDLLSLSKTFVASKEELIALACIEKPQIKLAFNAIFKQKHNLDIEGANINVANDLILYLLSRELTELNIEFLQYVNEDADISLNFNEEPREKIFVPKINILDNNQVVFLQNSNYEQSLNSMYHKFDDKNKGQFMVLLHENNLLDKTIINFYSSSIDDDNVALYSNNIGSFLDILNYTLPKSIEDIFKRIEEDEIGKKLLGNYKKTFPKEYEYALSYDISYLNKKSIKSFWKIVQVILGFEQSVLDLATSCLLEKGPRIDYKRFEQDKIYNQEFDFLKLIRSGISFKLAGVESNTISLGYVESYAHFIALIVDDVNSEIPLDGISLCGDLFANNLISNFIYKSITKNYKIYYNKDFVIQVS